jgi:tetratricopeptide (TPR) repeat protein
MIQNKKPVLIVALFLAALIVIPLLLLLITRVGSSINSEIGGGMITVNQKETDIADFDLRQLAEKANNLIEQDLAKALREGDVSLDFISELKRNAEMGRDAIGKGKLGRAVKYYSLVVQAAESQLAALALVEKARDLNDKTYSELQRLDYLKSSFENTYREAVETYNTALSALNKAEYQSAVDDFEMAGAILGDMEARAIQQIAGLLEAAAAGLEAYNLAGSRTAFESVLDLDKANATAVDGLVMVAALEGIAEEVKVIRALEASGDLEGALAEFERLGAEDQQNPFIISQRVSLEERILERDFQVLVTRSVQAEQAGDLGVAVVSLETAMQIKSSPEQQARLVELKEKYKVVRLEILLADGFDALKSGRYEAARNFYKESVALAPDSKEAREGLEKASNLYLANIRYSQSVAAATKQIKDGRFPIAAKLFNEAMASRPSTVGPSQQAEEARIRAALAAQLNEVKVTIESDKRTYVSIIGVLPPDRFWEEKLKLFPDVYKVRGNRSGYESVEIDLKVDATKPSPRITVECTEKL